MQDAIDPGTFITKAQMQYFKSKIGYLKWDIISPGDLFSAVY